MAKRTPPPCIDRAVIRRRIIDVVDTIEVALAGGDQRTVQLGIGGLGSLIWALGDVPPDWSQPMWAVTELLRARYLGDGDVADALSVRRERLAGLVAEVVGVPKTWVQLRPSTADHVVVEALSVRVTALEHSPLTSERWTVEAEDADDATRSLDRGHATGSALDLDLVRAAVTDLRVRLLAEVQRLRRTIDLCEPADGEEVRCG